MATSIRSPAVSTISLKEGHIVVVTAQDGSMAPPDAGFGLYLNDVRFLSRFELTLDDQPPLLLSASDRETYVATVQLVNDPMPLPDGRTLPRQALSIRRARFIDGGLRERIGILNSSPHAVALDVALDVDADFGDMFAVRGYRHGAAASVAVAPTPDGLTLTASGADGVVRETRVSTIPPPDEVIGQTLHYVVELGPQARFVLEARAVPTEDGQLVEPGSGAPFDDAIELLRDRYAAFLRGATHIATSDARVDDLLLRSALDLRALLDPAPTGPIPTAGIPWYAVPFGRDSLIVGFETLAFQPDLALGTLRFLARHQGQRVDPFTEEEPGKIFHELRRGELARLGSVPHSPYYGTVDATPLFVCLFVETVRWMGDRAAYDELLPSALAALAWCDTYGDPDGDGFVEYDSGPDSPLRNKGWKDSAASLSTARWHARRPAGRAGRGPGLRLPGQARAGRPRRGAGRWRARSSAVRGGGGAPRTVRVCVLARIGGLLRPGPRCAQGSGRGRDQQRRACPVGRHRQPGPGGPPRRAIDAPGHVDGLGDPDALDRQPDVQPDELSQRLRLAARQRDHRGRHDGLRPA